MASKKYPAFTDNAVVVMNRRYLKKDIRKNPTETPPDMLRRVSKDISLPEMDYGADEKRRQEVEDEFYEIQRMLYFLPNSPTLMNAGRELQQLSACFVLPVEDDLDCIFTRIRDTAIIHQSGGGTGFSFSRLRPNGDIVGSTGGVASGPVSFMQVYDMATEVVKQGGTRRGANMAILDCSHPDIIEFVNMKLDPNMMTNFNVSVSVSDDFMRAALANQDWPLRNPRNNQVTGTVNAGELLRMIVANAWATGDPGLIFLDKINDTHPNQHLGRITSTNPCVTGDCWIMTEEGPRQVDELRDTRFKIMDENGIRDTDNRGFYHTGHKETFWLKTTHGYRIRLTGDHRIKKAVEITDEHTTYRYVKARDLKAGDLIPMQRHDAEWPEPTGGDRQAQKDAQAVAQGRLMSATTISEMHRCSSRYHLDFAAQMIQRTGMISKDDKDNPHHMLLMMQPQAPVHDVQLMLLRLGVISRIVEDGLSIEARSMNYLMERLQQSSTEGFKPTANDENHQDYLTTFKSLEPAGEAQVYGVTVDQSGLGGMPVFDGQGFHLHNDCGEQPLLEYESCNLGSINLAQIRRNNPNDQDFWETLAKVCQTATRFLDNVIDRNAYPIDAIGERTRSTRRIGVGVMGFADLLIMDKIRYDSPTGTERAQEIMAFIQRHVHAASQKLAEERDPYPEWHNRTNIAEGEVPMRNTSPTTIAPTGTISIIAGTNSGIEPLFALAYERYVMDDDRLTEFNQMFLQEAERQGIKSDDPRMLQVVETGSIQELDFPQEMKEIFRVSHEIDPAWHVQMQAAWQQYCDNAVSKTVNMPEHATEDDVMTAYIQAWNSGCKGITVYRDGSKQDQVLSTAKSRNRAEGNEHDVEQSLIPQRRIRPDVLPGGTYRIRTGHGTSYVTVNNDDKGLPFEVFAAGGKSGGCEEAQTQAITRLATLAMRYHIPLEEITRQLTGIVCCPWFDNGIVIGSPADAIAEAMRRHNGDDRPRDTPRPLLENAYAASAPTTGDDGIIDARTHVMIQLAERRRAGLECPETDCKGTLAQTEGCATCTSCGWSNCG